jgi:serine/threonine protein phosphatase PrpC
MHDIASDDVTRKLRYMPKKAGSTTMSDEHKAALAKGREEGKIVRDYLEALRANKPKRGRKRTPESVNKRLDAIEEALPDASAMDELRLVQERRDLQTELERMGDTVDMTALEEAFVGVAKSYSESKKISYASWREVGVEARVLKAAGISRAD